MTIKEIAPMENPAPGDCVLYKIGALFTSAQIDYILAEVARQEGFVPKALEALERVEVPMSQLTSDVIIEAGVSIRHNNSGLVLVALVGTDLNNSLCIPEILAIEYCGL